MERELARQTIRANWRSIIINYTGTAQKRIAGKETYICPFCGHGSGGDGLTNNPKSKDGNSIKCFGGGCDFSGDIIEFVQRLKGVDYNAALKMCADDIGITIDPYRATAAADFSDKAENGPQSDFKPAASKEDDKTAKTAEIAPQGEQKADYIEYYKKCADRLTEPAAVSYLSARGISIETAKRYCIGYDPAADPASAPGATGNEYKPHPAPRLIMPVTRSFYVGRRVDGGHEYKKVNSKGGQSEIFNLSAVYSDVNAVFIVEGLIDALSIIEAGAAAVGLNSANNSGLFIKHLQAQAPKDKAFILCLDNDKDGQRAASKIKAELEALKIPFITADICGTHKDPNEALTSDRKAFIEAVRAAELAAVEEFNKDDLTRFFEKIQTTAYRPYKTGLNFFDKLLGGGIIMQTVTLLMAAPGTGKTTLCQQVAEEMANRGKSVIYLNLEMSKEQMIAKTLSARIAAAQKGHYTAKDILQGYRWSDEDRKVIKEAIDDYRKNVFPFIKYNPDEIGSDLDMILDYIDEEGAAAREAGKPAPAIVLDYLHLVTNSRGLDIQELIKQTITGIKNYCIKYDTFAIVIAAISREGAKGGPIRLDSGRDSSNIEYGCDAEISLNYKAIHKKETNPETGSVWTLAELQQQAQREMVLQALKSRFSPPGREEYCLFHAATNRFYEWNDFTPATEGETPYTEPEKKKPKRRG